MKSYYRLTAIKSTNPSPIYQDDKKKLNELCLKSYAQAYAEVKPDTTFICDFCPEDYKEMIDRIIPFKHDVMFTNLGINGTALLQYELANKQDDDILFQECDYIYVKNGGVRLVEGMNWLGLVSPYDHLNFYMDKTLHSPNVTLRLINGYHWRSCERNTMTFALKNKVFKDGYETFRHYGYLDGQVWYDMLERGHMMYVPITSLATHMAKDWLAPSVDWEAIWKTLI